MIIELEGLRLLSVLPVDPDLFFLGKRIEPAGHGKGLEHIDILVDREMARPVHPADHIHQHGIDLLDGHVKNRLGDIARNHRFDLVMHLLHGLACRFDFTDQRKENPAVRHHRHQSCKGFVFPERDL